ncbi:MAG TPA: NADPH:quinone oxidoreductase family protein [Ktedonobacterales bacterium]|jgi:NADPH2:quinone reductase
MKAVLCKAYGPPESLVVEDVSAPTSGQGQVVIQVAASGVNFPDTLIIEGKYQFKPPLPFSPGSEVAGTVAALGKGVSGVRVGDRVMAVPGWGGFAEEVAVDAEQLVPIPDSMDFPTAAAFALTYGTAHYALTDRGRLQPGQTLLVLGAAGGVGLAAVEVGAALGARVIAAASSDEKLALCRAHGASEGINYSAEDLRERIRALTGGEGVDVVLDPVGGSYAEPAIRGLAWDGRYLVIGFTAGEIPRIPLNLPLLKSSSIIGVFWGAFTARDPRRSREYLQELLRWFEAGKIRPYVSATYPFERAADALNALLARRATGKLVLVP